jgi:hypothetical protein
MSRNHIERLEAGVLRTALSTGPGSSPACFVFQVLPFYDRVAVELLRTFETEVYRTR